MQAKAKTKSQNPSKHNPPKRQIVVSNQALQHNIGDIAEQQDAIQSMKTKQKKLQKQKQSAVLKPKPTNSSLEKRRAHSNNTKLTPKKTPRKPPEYREKEIVIPEYCDSFLKLEETSRFLRRVESRQRIVVNHKTANLLKMPYRFDIK